ncbi:activator of the mannose operon, transcriptional antiterminator [Salinibacillus kushneri]|uniref:Activator of the mannose operon, transcriptional antiterminator n=1 Tax=Salinibacillus kushneri TaxID=237682 RepID=A0A1I0EQE1_9BACI|nr:PTS sugar transporter subunit IIA [Salinibacillus kushneri]SET46995.1 activator of the mannose operon, transcriptional antiterminator [Salinibacillus kushneri]
MSDISKWLFVKARKIIHKILLREKTSPTSIGGGVALPHAQPELVKKSVVGIATLKEPIEWGTEKVSIVFLMAIGKQDQRHLRSLMQTISSISESPEIREKLRKDHSKSDIIHLFSK